MDLKNYSTVLFVKNIEVSKSFYSDLLGLTINIDLGKDVIFDCGLTIWEINEKHVIPKTLGPEKIKDFTINRFEICFETEDIEKIYTTLKDKKIRFLHDIHVEPWGQQTIRFFDPDSHLIEIGESMRHFVRRFYNEGMTPEQISEKTSIPVDEVKNFLSR